MLLFLNSLGGGEVMLILLVVLLFFGSNKIPELARGLGKGIREFKDAADGIQREIEKGAQSVTEDSEIKKTIEEFKEDAAKISGPLDQLTDDKPENHVPNAAPRKN